jgi:hypothetical protein
MQEKIPLWAVRPIRAASYRLGEIVMAALYAVIALLVLEAFLPRRNPAI